MGSDLPSGDAALSRPARSAKGDDGSSRRGRPRDSMIDRAVLECAGKIIAEQGVAATTFEAVAVRAGTTRASIYRRWPTRAALLIDVLSHHSESPVPPRRGARARDELLDLLESFAEMTRGPLGKIGPPIIAELLSDPTARLAALTRSPSPELVEEAARRLGAALVEAGRSAADVGIRLEAMFGLLFLRSLVGAVPPDADLPARVVDLVVGTSADASVP